MLVGSRSGAEYGVFAKDAEGASPAIEAFEVGGVGGDVGDGLYLFSDVKCRILLVLAHLVHDLALVYEKERDPDAYNDGYPIPADTETDDDIDSNGAEHAEPCGSGVGEDESDEEQQGAEDVEKFALAFATCCQVAEHRQKERQNGSVGGVVVVEWLHHAVQHL